MHPHPLLAAIGFFEFLILAVPVLLLLLLFVFLRKQGK